MMPEGPSELIEKALVRVELPEKQTPIYTIINIYRGDAMKRLPLCLSVTVQVSASADSTNVTR